MGRDGGGKIGRCAEEGSSRPIGSATYYEVLSQHRFVMPPFQHDSLKQSSPVLCF
jgi:hypothetical protein